MNIDQKIQQALQQQASQVDELMVKDTGLFTRLIQAYQGQAGRWMWLVTLVGLLLTAGILWCGYQFCVAESVHRQIFYGVWLLVALILQSAVKIWSFMEINRLSVTREIKRVEVLLSELQSE